MPTEHHVTKTVTIPVEVFEELIAERVQAMRSAAGSVRAEGLTVDAEAQAIVQDWSRGKITTAGMRESVRRLYGVR